MRLVFLRVKWWLWWWALRIVLIRTVSGALLLRSYCDLYSVSKFMNEFCVGSILC